MDIEFRSYIGAMEKNMEATMLLGLYRCYIGIMEKGNYYRRTP